MEQIRDPKLLKVGKYYQIIPCTFLISENIEDEQWKMRFEGFSRPNALKFTRSDNHLMIIYYNDDTKMFIYDNFVDDVPEIQICIYNIIPLQDIPETEEEARDQVSNPRAFSADQETPVFREFSADQAPSAAEAASVPAFPLRQPLRLHKDSLLVLEHPRDVILEKDDEDNWLQYRQVILPKYRQVKRPEHLVTGKKYQVAVCYNIENKTRSILDTKWTSIYKTFKESRGHIFSRVYEERDIALVYDKTRKKFYYGINGPIETQMCIYIIEEGPFIQAKNSVGVSSQMSQPELKLDAMPAAQPVALKNIQESSKIPQLLQGPVQPVSQPLKEEKCCCSTSCGGCMPWCCAKCSKVRSGGYKYNTSIWFNHAF